MLKQKRIWSVRLKDVAEAPPGSCTVSPPWERPQGWISAPKLQSLFHLEFTFTHNAEMFHLLTYRLHCTCQCSLLRCHCRDHLWCCDVIFLALHSHLSVCVTVTYLFQWCVTGTVKMVENVFLLMSANANLAGTDQHATQVQHNTKRAFTLQLPRFYSNLTSTSNILQTTSLGSTKVDLQTYYLHLSPQIVTVAMTIQLILHYPSQQNIE